MKLINHPSVIQDIIDLALQLPPKTRNEPPSNNPVRRFLENVAAVANEIKAKQDFDTENHNAFIRHNREGVAREGVTEDDEGLF